MAGSSGRLDEMVTFLPLPRVKEGFRRYPAYTRRGYLPLARRIIKDPEGNPLLRSSLSRLFHRASLRVGRPIGRLALADYLLALILLDFDMFSRVSLYIAISAREHTRISQREIGDG